MIFMCIKRYSTPKKRHLFNLYSILKRNMKIVPIYFFLNKKLKILTALITNLAAVKYKTGSTIQERLYLGNHLRQGSPSLSFSKL